jgi:hypothetical protein
VVLSRRTTWQPLEKALHMKFRLKAFGFHLLGSACLLALVLGGLYLGWYQWPGWYLTGVLHIATILACVDLVLGPTLTLLIADPKKPRRSLARDIAVIAAVQIAALIYGSLTLWHGRPLYYTFSENLLEMVQASDLDPTQIELARKSNPDFVPHWYSRPRWIWAPLPADKQTREQIMTSSIAGGTDVIQMPRYFKSWEQGISALRQQLKKVDDMGQFSLAEKRLLKQRMSQQGFASERANAIPMMGHARPLLAVFDLTTLQIQALLRPE